MHFCLLIIVQLICLMKHINCRPDPTRRTRNNYQPPEDEYFQILNDDTLDSYAVQYTFPKLYSVENGKYLQLDHERQLYKLVKPPLSDSITPWNPNGNAVMKSYIDRRFPWLTHSAQTIQQQTNLYSFNYCLRIIGKHLMLVKRYVPIDEPSNKPYLGLSHDQMRTLHPYFLEFEKRYYIDILAMLLNVHFRIDDYDNVQVVNHLIHRAVDVLNAHDRM